MENKLELPSGGWAILREPAAVPVRLRRPVEKALIKVSKQKDIADALTADSKNATQEEIAAKVAEQLDSESMDILNDLNDCLILARVESWSFGDITIDKILDLPGADYSVLQTEAAKGITEMMPNFSNSGDPNSPLNPSAA